MGRWEHSGRGHTGQELYPSPRTCSFRRLFCLKRVRVKYGILMNLSNDKPALAKAKCYVPLLRHETKCLYKIQVIFWPAANQVS